MARPCFGGTDHMGLSELLQAHGEKDPDKPEDVVAHGGEGAAGRE